MIVSSLILLLLLLHSVPAQEDKSPLSAQKIQDISCLLGLCVVAEGCEGNPIWRRVLKWPERSGIRTDCEHAFMIRRNLDPARKEKKDKEVAMIMQKQGEEYFIVIASGGPHGPAREMRLENSMLKPIFAVTHDGLNTFDDLRIKEKKRMTWTIDSYDYQKITNNSFEAGILARIKNGDGTKPLSEMWEDLCIFIHNSRSMQHLCGGLERIFQRIPSKQFPMKRHDCSDDLDEDTIIEDTESGYFKCSIHDDVLKWKFEGKDDYVRLHYALCLAGKSMYLVEHHLHGFYSLQYKTSEHIKCGDASEMNTRCHVPMVPPDVNKYCGVRCEQAGKTRNPVDGEKADVLRCDFLNAVIDGKVYRKGDTVPDVECDPTGWWRYSESREKEGLVHSNKWISSMYCFYPQSDVFSDCVLDRFKCGKYGDCPEHRHHQVDCDGNVEGLVLAVFHSGFKYGFQKVSKLGCDDKNGWWTVNGKPLPQSAYVECVWPFELEILKRASEADDWEPLPFEARALSQIGPSVRTASLIVAVICVAVVIAGIVVVKTRLEGPKTRMVTRHLRSLYPSLLNEEERLDAAKAEKEYRSVDCEAAGLALHQIYKMLQEQEGENKEKEMLLHMHWQSLTWPKKNLLLERALLHRAFFCLKVLYDKFNLPGDQQFEDARPGLREKIIKVSMEYKSFTENWTPNEFLYSIAFATLTKAELDAFRRNVVTRKVLRAKPLKEMSVMNMMPDVPDVDASKNAMGTPEATPVVPTAETATAVAPTVPIEKVEETTAPPPDKESKE